MRVLITGSEGFIGKNLQFKLKEIGVEFFCFNKNSNPEELKKQIELVNFIFHFAGVNRPEAIEDFEIHNQNFTELVCNEIVASGRKIPVLFTSSIQALSDNPYGLSKLNAENFLLELKEFGSKIYIFRLANVFGKWSRPNYNSVVATFCNNVIYQLPLTIDDPEKIIKLSYIDDVISDFINILFNFDKIESFVKTPDFEEITVGKLAEIIQSFGISNFLPHAGFGLTRKLYATFLSFKKPGMFSYKLDAHKDERGKFVEFLKAPNFGQVSYFTAGPNVTRGGHYHHTKNEKFLVVKGKALFRFINIVTNENYALEVDGLNPTVVETIPGWAHNITNLGADEMIVIIWANEIFDKNKPDTIQFRSL